MKNRTRIINAIKVPELNGKPIVFTKNNSIELKNFNVEGSNSLKIAIRIITPITFAITKL